MAISDIKTLRELTGAGFLDCKNALNNSGGDIQKAITWLKEKGISKASKKSGRIATEGIAKIFISNDKAIICEINAETDFVAKNEEFLQVCDKIGQTILNKEPKDLNEALKMKINNEQTTINDLLIQTIAKIGEKISLRRFQIIKKEQNQIFGFYIHKNQKIATINVLEGGDEVVAKNIAMHIAALNPKYMTMTDVNQQELEKELNFFKQEAIKQGKPEAIAIKIAQGRVEKNLSEVCLLKQEYVKENNVSVEKYLENNQAKLVFAKYYQVGEGIEKKEIDFASEVNSQIKSVNK